MQWSLCLSVLCGLQSLSVDGFLPFPLKSDSVRAIPASDRYARQTARVAIHYLNYLAASPNNLLILGEVTKATVKGVPGIGHKYYIEFTTDDFKTNQKVGTCFGTVFFQSHKPRPAVNVNCTNNNSQNQINDDDYNLYEKIKQQSKPITANEIPDSFGHIDPSHEPLRDLALAGSSLVMWEKSTEKMHYYMAQVKSVKQWARRDDFIDFDYNILLHEIPTQEIVPCHMRVIWYPGEPLKVKYECFPLSRSEESEEGSSGSHSEEGSASYGNF
ncbi:hypothetical protein NDU88_001204 [Pleurodeles waltl]|uniref:Cystatin LXN-type domain-containing protein n=1 Tax=Pleurodeles waltl TaxID=8319 RepID=A0AAV7LC37_PLEWA|nr:hypothetical protein NDU88_001204 [Pleurodeles waltl]